MKTYICLILDKSGSMEKSKKQTIESFNEQIQQIKSDDDQDSFFSLITFNGKVFEHCWNENTNSVEELNDENYTTK